MNNRATKAAPTVTTIIPINAGPDRPCAAGELFDCGEAVGREELTIGFNVGI